MKNVYIGEGASVHAINSLADWIRQTIAQSVEGNFDVIRFIELDIQRIFPSLYVHILNDNEMGASRAYIQEDPLAIVVSESIYNGACSGCLFSTETILHEVGHLILHRRYAKTRMNSSSSRYENEIIGAANFHSAEWQANIFAICLLYPYDSKEELSWESFSQRYRGTRRQFERLKRHVSRLKARERHRHITQERRWVEKVVNTLHTPVEPSGSESEFQLSLFASLGSKDRSPVPNRGVSQGTLAAA